MKSASPAGLSHKLKLASRYGGGKDPAGSFQLLLMQKIRLAQSSVSLACYWWHLGPMSPCRWPLHDVICMRIMDISKHKDIVLEKSNYDDVKNINCNDTEIKYDWFDCYAQEIETIEIYSIIKNVFSVGYIAMYNKDDINRNISIYGKVAEKQYFGDFLKAILSMMEYIFICLNFNRINFIYREDNFFLMMYADSSILLKKVCCVTVCVIMTDMLTLMYMGFLHMNTNNILIMNISECLHGIMNMISKIIFI